MQQDHCLFFIYVNDLPDVTGMKLFHYADYTMLLCKETTTLRGIADKELTALDDRFKANTLALNEDKTQIINFRASSNRDSSNSVIFLNLNYFHNKMLMFIG